MKFSKLNILGTVFILLVIAITSCNDGDDPKPDDSDNFDRSEMLSFWADHIIIPSFEAYDANLTDLVNAKNAFVNDRTPDNLSSLRSSWLAAYKAWQSVAMFDVGKAEEIGYRNYVNIYPTDDEEIERFISSEDYDLSLPSTFDAQGFPALDYLLFGLGNDDAALLEKLKRDDYTDYMSGLVDRLKSLNTEVLSDWKSQYRTEFIENDGASATASTDKVVNDFLFYYEKYFRAGKIGIPAGVFSGTPISTTVEAPYSGVYSKELFFEAFEAIQRFFHGESFDKTSNGPSLKQYLKHVQSANQTVDIATSVEIQWLSATSAANDLMNNFKQQVEVDNDKMLVAYDEIQKVVVLLKVDMMQALNIQVDYVDADGD